MSLLKMRQEWQKLATAIRVVQERVTLLSTFTTHPIVPYLGLALEEVSLPSDIRIGPYNQMVQQCLDPTSETASLEPTILIAWPRLEELWSGKPLPLLEPVTSFVNEALELADVFLDAVSRWQATLIFVLPAIPEERPLGIGDACNPLGVFAVATAVREALRHRLTEQQGVLLLDAEEVIRFLGSATAYNRSLLALAHIPFSEEFFYLMANRLTRLIRLSRRPTRKVIVLDGDNTLWGGIIGEDGVLGVDLNANGPGAAFRDFQAFLLELRRSGMLLALCSRNEERDIRAVFARPEMQLKFEMLSAWRISWQSKAVSIQEIADELKLGVESFVFIDDNAAEIAEVQAAFPHVACVRMPEDPADWLDVLQSTEVVDRLPPVLEDVKRAIYYQQERLRADVSAVAPSPEVYLQQLNIKVVISPPTAADMPRLVQLIAKTNQFNLNCRRRLASDLSRLCADPHYVVRLTHVRDRFGDYGIVGACIVSFNPNDVELDTFVMSCRVMGRGIEEAMLADVFTVVMDHGASNIGAIVEECPHNKPARVFFARFGSQTMGVRSLLHCPCWPSYIKQQQRTPDM